ncbi:MAG: hypothetical protein ABID64_04930 [Nitrospirota bacterium]
MPKKEITWSTPRGVVKALEPIPEEPFYKKISKIKYCKKTKGKHSFKEKERHDLGSLGKIFGHSQMVSYECLLCGKKNIEFK